MPGTVTYDSSRYGAKAAYTTYEADQGTLSAGATVKKASSPTPPPTKQVNSLTLTCRPMPPFRLQQRRMRMPPPSALPFPTGQPATLKSK